LTLARQEGLAAILDPAPAQPLARALLGQVDILTPNENEALTLLGRPVARVSSADAPDLAVALRAMGPATVIVKLGDRGCCLATGRGVRHFPAYRVEVRDTTAAGDTFNAALAVALTEGRSVEEAIPFANAAAAVSVTRLGAQASAPSRSEVEAMMKFVG
jgi:ribokinase